MRAVAGRPVKIRFRLEDEGGTLTDADASTQVSVVVNDGSGTEVGTGVATSETTGIYAYTLTAVPTKYDVLTATATATLGGETVTLVEPVRLVDRRVVPPSVLRTYPELADLSIPDFLRAMDEAEEWATAILNFSPVVTGDRREFRVREYTARLEVPRIFYPLEAYDVTYNDVVYDPTKLDSLVVRSHAFEYQTAYYTGGYDPVLGVWGPMFPPGVYNAWVSHGQSSVPADLARAVGKLAQHTARTSNYPDRATRIMTEASEIWFSTPDGDTRLTGLPEVDGVLMRYRLATPFAEDSGSF